MDRLTTHLLDLTCGQPAAGMTIQVCSLDGDARAHRVHAAHALHGG